MCLATYHALHFEDDSFDSALDHEQLEKHAAAAACCLCAGSDLLPHADAVLHASLDDSDCCPNFARADCVIPLLPQSYQGLTVSPGPKLVIYHSEEV